MVGVRLPECSDELITLITNLLALTPGTMPLELVEAPRTLYVHALHLDDPAATRRQIRRLTSLAVRSFGSDEDVARLCVPTGAGQRDPGHLLLLAAAGALFCYRTIRGPSLSSRVVGIDGAIVTGMSVVIVHAMDTGQGAYLPVAVVLGARLVHLHLRRRPLHRRARRE